MEGHKLKAKKGTFTDRFSFIWACRFGLAEKWKLSTALLVEKFSHVVSRKADQLRVKQALFND